MKLKSTLKYQIADYQSVFLIYYAIMLFISVSSIVWKAAKINGMEMSGMITSFIVGICIFAESFQLLIQHGISRKTIFVGRICTTVAMSAFMAFIDQIYIAVLKIVTEGDVTVQSFISLCFPEFMSGMSGILGFALSFLLSFLLICASTMAGYFLAVLFYRSSKVGRILVAAGTPIFFFVILQLIIDIYWNTAFVQAVFRVIKIMVGAESGNPYYLLGTLCILFAIFTTANFMLVRKAPLQRK